MCSNVFLLYYYYDDDDGVSCIEQLRLELYGETGERN